MTARVRIREGNAIMEIQIKKFFGSLILLVIMVHSTT
jgi:hypothetical protein